MNLLRALDSFFEGKDGCSSKIVIKVIPGNLAEPFDLEFRNLSRAGNEINFSRRNAGQTSGSPMMYYWDRPGSNDFLKKCSVKELKIVRSLRISNIRITVSL